MWNWYQDLSQCSAKPENNLYLFKTRSQRNLIRWSDSASLNRYSQEESLMHFEWCDRDIGVEKWDFPWTWSCISMSRWWIRTTQYQTWDGLPKPTWNLILWQNWPLKCLLSNWTWRGGKRYMQNQHISGTVQDVPTNSGSEKLFFNLPELHRINTQRNQNGCSLSRRCVGV